MPQQLIDREAVLREIERFMAGGYISPYVAQQIRGAIAALPDASPQGAGSEEREEVARMLEEYVPDENAAALAETYGLPAILSRAARLLRAPQQQAEPVAVVDPLALQKHRIKLDWYTEAKRIEFGILDREWQNDDDRHAKLVADVCFAIREAVEAAAPQQQAEQTEVGREFLGKIVRMVWMEWAREQTNPKPSWLQPWDELTEPEREVDRRIGERIYNMAIGCMHAALPPAQQQAEPASTSAWVVQDGGGRGEHRFRTMKQGFTAWTLDLEEALQFARRRDAELFAQEDEDAWVISQVATSAPPPDYEPRKDQR